MFQQKISKLRRPSSIAFLRAQIFQADASMEMDRDRLQNLKLIAFHQLSAIFCIFGELIKAVVKIPRQDGRERESGMQTLPRTCISI